MAGRALRLGGSIIGLGLALGLVGATGAPAAGERKMSAHDFTFTAIDGQALPLRSYAGKAVLIVNTA